MHSYMSCLTYPLATHRSHSLHSLWFCGLGSQDDHMLPGELRLLKQRFDSVVNHMLEVLIHGKMPLKLELN